MRLFFANKAELFGSIHTYIHVPKAMIRTHRIESRILLWLISVVGVIINATFLISPIYMYLSTPALLLTTSLRPVDTVWGSIIISDLFCLHVHVLSIIRNAGISTTFSNRNDANEVHVVSINC